MGVTATWQNHHHRRSGEASATGGAWRGPQRARIRLRRHHGRWNPLPIAHRAGPGASSACASRTAWWRDCHHPSLRSRSRFPLWENGTFCRHSLLYEAPPVMAGFYVVRYGRDE